MAGSRIGSMSPGALRGEVRLTLQTQHAQRLLEGRPRRAELAAIRGLMVFSDAVREIWRAAQVDDPYADWYLVQIDEERLRRSGATLEDLKSDVREAAGASPLEWTAAHSGDPVRVQLRLNARQSGTTCVHHGLRQDVVPVKESLDY